MGKENNFSDHELNCKVKDKSIHSVDGCSAIIVDIVRKTRHLEPNISLFRARPDFLVERLGKSVV